jgi:L-seryl-tRNA(Ser) seleniumtransferase
MERREFLKSSLLAPAIATERVSREEPSARAEGERSESRSEKRWGWGGSARIEEARTAESVAAELEDNIYTRLLGVRPHLGAHEHISRLSGSRMPPEVIEALVEANRFFVDMEELSEAAGRKLAELLGAEAALVTAGGFSSMILGAAGCLTGTDPAKIDALPHPDWPKRECLIQKAHRFDYDRAYRAAGMTIVEAEDRKDLLGKINENTAMIPVLAAVEEQRPFGPPVPRKRALPPEPDALMPEELIAIGKKAGVPVLVDMASDLPPARNLTRWIEAGADLVVVSGGKGLRGPQSTGILAGRKDLVEAAALNASPHTGIGRGMKVGKEETVALVVALERYLKLDHEKEIAEWGEKARWLASRLQGIRGLSAEYAVNTKGYADVDLSWDERVIPLTQDELKKRLRAGKPGVVYDGTTVRVRQLDQAELELVARRLREVFESL